MKLKYRNQKNAEIISKYFSKPLDKPDWFEIRSLADGQEEIFIYDYIGWPFNDPFEIVSYLSANKDKDFLVRVNSPGGDVFDGVSIYEAFNNHGGNITMRIEGLSASMASVVALAGKETQIYPSSMVMIHNPWTVMAGDWNDFVDIASVLKKITGNMIDIYQEKSNAGKREITSMMNAETWMTAKEAEEKGFVDTILKSGKAVKANFDLSVFSNVPDGMSGDKEDRVLTVRAIEKFLRDGGVSGAKAKAILAGCREIGGIDDVESGEASKRNADDVITCTTELEKIIQTIKGKN